MRCASFAILVALGHAAAAQADVRPIDVDEARTLLAAQHGFEIGEVTGGWRADIDGDGAADDWLVRFRPAGDADGFVNVWIETRYGPVLAFHERADASTRFDVVEAREGPGYLVRWSRGGSGGYLTYDAFRYRANASFAELRIAAPREVEHADGLIFFSRGEAVIRDAARSWRLSFDDDNVRLEPAVTGRLGNGVRVLELTGYSEATLDGAPLDFVVSCPDGDGADLDRAAPDPAAPPSCDAAPGASAATLSIALDEAIELRSDVALPRVVIEPLESAGDAGAGPVLRAALGPSRLIQPLRTGAGRIMIIAPGYWTTTLTVEISAAEE